MKRIRLPHFLKQKRVFIPLIIVVIAIGAGLFMVLSKENPSLISEQTEEVKYYSQLTGREVTKEVSERPILGVMIENSEFARPQTGISSAGIVFEAVTEGGITRYLLLYQEDQPEVVGPVRSVRTHFVDWLMGFDASVAHVGGSEEALRLIDERGTKSLNQFYNPDPYYRDSEREAPHNMYAKTSALRSLEEEKKYSKSNFADIPRSDDSQSESPDANLISIDFSSPEFAVEFKYDKTSNTYTRFLAGKPHVDNANKKPISVNNLVVVKTKGLTFGVDAIGKGDALLFKNGTVKKITWEQDDYKNRIKFLDEQGVEIPLNKGHTWIAAVAKERTVKY